MPQQITFYTAKVCPAGLRVEMALRETKAEYTRYIIDLTAKPEWFSSRVNPVSGKVPAIAYGGPPTAPDDPSPESAKLIESLVLVEFVADLFPSSTIRPKDPVECAQARIFVDAVNTKFLAAYVGASQGGVWEPLWDALDALQKLLTPGKKYAISDEFTNADIAFLTLFAYMEVWLRNDLGAFPPGEGLKGAEYLFGGERFTKLLEYYERLKQRESFKQSFDANLVKEVHIQYYAAARAQFLEAAAAKP
ncbi:hypothetical protein FB45DRAFT_828822 [Roridomyces roridus]|uniref:Glutathione S-transferase n=1 Tax=Roridomyces roridus TaxID=1738132 RepID=A0AAD7C1J4_9AGAR|nr:hypothetical protein FB45DRAFT_828822 [Roridomyces roridus]